MENLNNETTPKERTKKIIDQSVFFVFWAWLLK